MIFYQLLCLLLLTNQAALTVSVSLSQLINQLNKRLKINTNFIYCNQSYLLDYYEDIYFSQLKPISRMIFTSTQAYNISYLDFYLGTQYKLFVVIVDDEPPYDFFHSLDLRFQKADFLMVLNNKLNQDKWLKFIENTWQQGYVKLLFYSTWNNVIYGKRIFPKIIMKPTSLENYLKSFNSFKDIQGYPVRVLAYTNVPRTIIYKDAKNKTIYGGYKMRFIRAFLASRNASFVPVHPSSSAPESCLKALVNKSVDLCSDAMAPNHEVFAITGALKLAYANVMVPHAKPLLTYRYLVAPFQRSVWLCLILYVIVAVGFVSWIHFRQSGRLDWSKHFLDIFSSLLFRGFALRDIHGKQRLILFLTIFISGFVVSTMYLGLLKSLLISETFEREINTFEELAASNISLLVDDFEVSVFKRFNMPNILWSIAEIVPIERLRWHRTNFDQNYAFTLYSDRMELYDFAQRFLGYPRIRRIPISFGFIFAGFPMRKNWFLKSYLSVAWANAFESGLIGKLEADANAETVREGFLNFLVADQYEAVPLDIYYFAVMGMCLALGYSLAFLSFLMELVTWRLIGNEK